MSPMVSVALLPSQKYKRENIATRLIRHLLSQNGEKSRDMFVSDAILNQSSLDVRCVFVGCSALFWCEHTTLSTMLHRFKSAMWGMFRSEPSLRWIKTLFSSQSLWPLLFVNQDSILCLGPKREPDSVDFILLMILIFNASFGGLPRMVVQEDSLNKIFSSNFVVPHVKYHVWNEPSHHCGTLTGRLENYSKVFTNCAVSQTQSRHSSNISF